MAKGMKTLHVVTASVLSACLLALGTTASATVNVSQVPLLVSTSVDPNILFIIDDSGSMQWETMPDELTARFGTGINTDYVMWMFPRIADLHGGTPQYSNTRVVRFTGNLAAHYRSARNNTIYYNPAYTYRPWSNADGTLMADAPPAAAPNRPLFTGFGTRDLTANATQTRNWMNDDGTHTNESQTYYPAVYYHYVAGDPELEASYQRVEIRSTIPTYGGHGRENREDCAGAGNTPPSCTYAEEIQNFANWYSYHRNRIFASRGAIGAAFANQSTNMRVGYGAINKDYSSIDGEDTRTVVRGVRQFSGADRQAFFDDLYERPVPAAGTPLRLALRGAGEYFERDDDRGPWSDTPGQAGGGDHLTCRQSYSILMSDGYWNGNTPSVGNQDGSGSTSHTGPGVSGGYTVGPPFEDSYSDTLADVAMRFWKNDLRPTLENKVPTSPINPAFWQHMVTFTVGLGVQGSITPPTRSEWNNLESWTPSAAWPDPHPAGANAAKIDDMLHAAVNGRGGFFSATEPDVFARELSDVLLNISERVGSAASVAANSTRLETGTRIYQARFNSGNWTGDLLSFGVNPDGSVGAEQWNAASGIPNHATRNILTFVPGSGGAEFKWNQLSPAQQLLLNADGNGADRVAYLRGATGNEQRNGGDFRNRVSLLGDIVNSDPAFMGRQDYGMYNLPNAAENSSYRDFLATKASRPEVIFVGANDGMLHAFDANTGVELFAYVPNGVMQNLPELSDPNYTHRFFVDGSPRLLDVCLVNNPDDCTVSDWRTVLVGSTGAGGRSVFALDVTNPTAFGPNNVLWEYSSPDLGVAVGQPSIIKLPSGQWAAIFGNGYNSTDHRAKLIMVNLVTGTVINTIDTEVGTAADTNGMATPIPIDLTGNRVTDLIYAGDYQGNLWRMSMTGQVFPPAFRSGTTPVPLYRAMGPAVPGLPGLVRQSISVRPEVGRHPDGGQMVYFGTGKYFETGDNVVPSDPPIQTFYGIRDNGAPVSGRGELAEQTIVLEGLAGVNAVFDYRIMSNNLVDYSTGTHKGWYLDLNSPVEGPNGERVIGNALLRSGRIIFVSVTPTPDPCDYGGFSWLMELDAISGARLNYAVFDVDGDGVIDANDILALTGGEEGHAGGRRINDVVTSPYILDTGGDTEYKYMSGASGSVTVVEEAASGVNLGRQSWEQLR